MVATTFGEVVEASSKMQALGYFAGTYAATGGTNSTVIIGVFPTFGMAVQS
jgi:hypothetical protein